MNSRERVRAAISHQQPDRAPIDIGGTGFTGIAAATMNELRSHLGLEDIKIKVAEPYTMVALMEEDLRKNIGVDVIGLPGPATKFGYKNTSWKPWKLPQNGLDVLVGEGFITKEDKDGDIYAYPQGDTSVEPSGMVPKGGFYFDALVRREEFDAETASGREDYKDDFTLYSDDYLKELEATATDYYENTDYSIYGSIRGAGLGNLANIPGTDLLRTPGIRDATEWLMALMMNKDYVKEVFEYQTEVVLKNLEMYRQAVGDKIDVILIGDTDFGMQNSEFISPASFRELYKPYFKIMNDWVHENTNWKTFYHSCGSIVNLLDDFVDMGVDIINPVQCSAKGMDPQYLKDKYKDTLTFWGGGINTQQTLPFGTPEEVKSEVKERLRIFSESGGYIFAPIHNIQANTPPGNIKALFDAYKEYYNV